MPWQRRYFKGNKVWVEIDDDGELITNDEDRVAMKYSEGEDAKVYHAYVGNVSSKTADEIENGSKSRQSGTNDVGRDITSTEAAGEPQRSQEVPEELRDIDPPTPGTIEIHTDGACSGNPGPCGVGIVMRSENSYFEIKQYLGEGTNNIAELAAIKSALEEVNRRDLPVRLYTDSRYSIGVLTEGWKARANRDLILSIRELIDAFDDLKIEKIAGHAGEPLNERADDLARTSIPGNN